ncbi:hypothetical protein PINS_up011037 [Pythium insidiosum]|nr:hypothetical protein PINS_up011037 [Pythium insidiosum]
MPIVRHRHVGDNGLYTWHRGTGRVQHNQGVKDGINSMAWDLRRDAVLAVSCVGALHVLEEEFKTAWPGTMYPPGFRLITDNEYDTSALERELAQQEAAAAAETHKNDDDDSSTSTSKNTNNISLLPATEERPSIDVFTLPATEDAFEKRLPPVTDEVLYIPSIHIVPHYRRLHQLQHHQDFHVERHFGLGQSVLEPLKSAIKRPSNGASKKKKKKSSDAADKTKSSGSSSSSKKRRR